jgi:antitoxin CcdA
MRIRGEGSMSNRRKIATNLSARADIVTEAKQLGINLSEVFESAVIEAVRRRRREAWLAENRDAIESYNARVARDGLFGDAWRKF